MAVKGEIKWKRVTEDGVKQKVCAEPVGDQWHFYTQDRRYDNWQPLEDPPLEEWLELMDAVRRRIARRLMRPEAEGQLRRRILRDFPDAGL